ncbi:Spermidine/putrescine import ATP-binding protein PotA [Methylobacterium crusticola]|uniref:Spermidine/putrescine import ATP-binding protein PotA n=1 Tax=Methylobacterium crusticola TaxID=1697972 RepID=A0ABQ4R5R5_9HYPH|nr:ABC transporter ATP-binding protein [Methylobacterium crusticola]GJD53023.1 Spermidine/putrescine import ATP-binding protein PotA [Methylobacterium crusticola]
MTSAVPLKLIEVSKSFGSLQALKPLTLGIGGGEMLALLGPSGCGKTTTLRIIAGFEAPDTGQVVIGGVDVTDLPPNRRGLGMVFQNYSLFPHMSVGANVAYGLRMRGVPAAERTARVRRILGLVRLEQYEDRQIHQLSGGQQQRVALARSLVTNPSVLLLDEPLGALDKNLRERMQFELREIQRRLGITSIIVTHDQEEALTMSDRVAVMAEGRIVQVGPPTEVYEHPRTRFVSEFLGTANIFSGIVADRAGPRSWSVALDLDRSPRSLVESDEALAAGHRVLLAVRPERLKLGPPEADGIRARVQDVVFRGSYFAYELAVPGSPGPVFAYAQAREAVPADGIVGVSWGAGGAIVLRDAP